MTSEESVKDEHSEFRTPHSTLILGVGNTLRGDDGFGPQVIEWLNAQDLPEGVRAVDGGTAGLDLVSMLMGQQRAIIVDAAELGRAPGEWLRFALSDVQLKPDGASLSLHSAGLAEALMLGAALKVLPPEVIIYGVQPQNLDWRPQLSAEVQAAVPQVGQAILSEVIALNEA